MQSIRRLLGRDKPVVRVIPLVGSIMARSGGGRSLNFAGVQKQVEDAFDCKKVQPKAVVLNINSPGGSAVQSNLIYSRIRNLADKTKVPVISFIEDTCASGGYWLALAGDEIYADPNSVVGSIGALSMVFGVEETLKKLGFESRIIKAGKNKFRSNPFEPQNPDDVVWTKNFLSEIHDNFKALVKERRKSLDLNHKTIFEADVFTGRVAAKIGLIDGVHSDLSKLIKDRYGDEVVLKKMQAKRRFPFFSNSAGAELRVDAADIIHGISEAGMESKFKTY